MPALCIDPAPRLLLRGMERECTVPKPSPEFTRTRASAAGHQSWANTRDRAARTAPARAARWAKYLERARELQGPDAPLEAVEKAAEHLYRADLARMSLKAAKARAARKAAS